MAKTPKIKPPDPRDIKDGVKDLKNTPPKPKKFKRAKSNQYKL